MHVNIKLIRYTGTTIEDDPGNSAEISFSATANRVRQEVFNHVHDAEIVKTLLPGQSIEISSCKMTGTAEETQDLLNGVLSQWISGVVRGIV